MGWKLIFLFFSLKAFAEPSYITFPSDIDWRSRSSAHFEIMFQAGSDRFAERTLLAAEKAYRLLHPVFPETPDKTFIVLSEFQDSTNGYALNFPYSHMVIFAAPPASRGQLAAVDDWLDSLVLHEFVHIVHLYPAHGLWRPMRTIFGTWVVPNGLMPSHLHEGMAVFWETELTRGGRGKGKLFSMYQRKAVEAGVWGESFLPIDRMDGVTSIFPHGVSAYFFGHELYADLYKRKGAKGFTELTNSFSSNWPYWINIPFSEVYGKDYRDLWNETFDRTRRESQKEIEAIKKTPLSKLSYLTRSRFVKSEMALSPNQKQLLIKRSTPQEGEYFVVVDLETTQTVDTVGIEAMGAEGLCWVSVAGKPWWIYNAMSVKYQHAEFSLYAYSPEEKRTVRLDTEDHSLNHVHRLSCAPDLSSLLIYQETGGVGKVKELEFNGEGDLSQPLRVRKEWKVPEGAWVSAVVAPDSHQLPLWFALRQGTATELYRWKSEAEPTRSTSFEGHVSQLDTLADTSELVAIADFDGRSELWRLMPEAHKGLKLVGVTGGIQAFAQRGNRWLVSSYEQGGFDIAEASVVDSGVVELPTAIATHPKKEKATLSPTEDYSPWSTLYPHAWVPSVFFVNSGVQVGAWIPGFDLSQKHLYDIYGGYDSRGQPFLDTAYTRRFGKSSSLGFSAYYSPGYLPSEQDFLRRWGGGMTYGFDFPFTPFKAALSLLYRKLEGVTLVSGTPVAAKQSVGVGASLKYSFGFKKRPLAIAPSSGTTLTVGHSQFLTAMGSSDDYFSMTATAKQHLAAPWWRDSFFVFDVKAGYTEGTTFLNSYFESGGEVLFSQARALYQNRGFLPSTFLGRRMFNVSAEHLVPIARIEHGVGLLPFLLKDLHCAFVADATSYDFGVQSTFNYEFMKIFHPSAGFELRSQWVVGYYLPTTLRAGVYRGFGPGGEDLYITFGAEAGL